MKSVDIKCNSLKFNRKNENISTVSSFQRGINKLNVFMKLGKFYNIQGTKTGSMLLDETEFHLRTASASPEIGFTWDGTAQPMYTDNSTFITPLYIINGMRDCTPACWEGDGKISYRYRTVRNCFEGSKRVIRTRTSRSLVLITVELSGIFFVLGSSGVEKRFGHLPRIKNWSTVYCCRHSTYDR